MRACDAVAPAESGGPLFERQYVQLDCAVGASIVSIDRVLSSPSAIQRALHPSTIVETTERIFSVPTFDSVARWLQIGDAARRLQSLRSSRSVRRWLRRSGRASGSALAVSGWAIAGVHSRLRQRASERMHTM